MYKYCVLNMHTVLSIDEKSHVNVCGQVYRQRDRQSRGDGKTTKQKSLVLIVCIVICCFVFVFLISKFTT